MKIKFLGHACLQITTSTHTLIVDPFITENPLAKHIDVDALQADYIVLTHAHFDHVADVEAIVAHTKAKVIANYEIANHYQNKGMEVAYVNAGAGVQFDFGYLKGTIAHHSSSFVDGTYGGTAQGYILEADGKRIYIAGDTALTQDMELIPETIGLLDLAVLPIGNVFTMGYKDALTASQFVECDTILGYHYDTFPPIEINKEEVRSYFKEKGKEILLLNIGEEMSI